MTEGMTLFEIRVQGHVKSLSPGSLTQESNHSLSCPGKKTLIEHTKYTTLHTLSTVLLAGPHPQGRNLICGFSFRRSSFNLGRETQKLTELRPCKVG